MKSYAPSEKSGGGTGKLTYTLVAGAGGGNRGFGGFQIWDTSHPYSTITLTSKTGTWGGNNIEINGVDQGSIALNTPYDIKGKTVVIGVYNGGSGSYSNCTGVFVLE